LSRIFVPCPDFLLELNAPVNAYNELLFLDFLFEVKFESDDSFSWSGGLSNSARVFTANCYGGSDVSVYFLFL
jgi:hypothetical protein